MHLYLTLQLLAPKLLSLIYRLRLPNYVELISKYDPQSRVGLAQLVRFLVVELIHPGFKS
jgi:hypothetical protein